MKVLTVVGARPQFVKAFVVSRALEAAGDIREVLVQRAITDRANQWIDETRASLKIDVIADGSQP